MTTIVTEATNELAAEREFAFTARDFERVRKFLFERAGIALTSAKHNMVYSRLSRRLRARGLNNFSDYLALLERQDAEEWEAFTNALTTNLTGFFREAHHFPILTKHLRAQRRAGSMTLWCAAVSTGEEAYSMAITACETFGSMTPPIRIIASDIDTQVIAIADRGAYPLERVSCLGAERLARFFESGRSGQAARFRVRPELRALIDFRRINLLDRWWPVPAPLTAIFCRNVMIYFKAETQRDILARFAPLLAPSGLLFAGHSETFLGAGDLFRLQGKTVYVRLGHALS